MTHPIAHALSCISHAWHRVARQTETGWAYDLPQHEIAPFRRARDEGLITTAQKRIGDDVILVACAVPARERAKFVAVENPLVGNSKPGRIVRLVCVGFVLFAAAAAMAAPPPGADPNGAIARWVHTLKKRSTGGDCCNFSDCRRASIRAGTHGDYEVFVGKSAYGETAPDEWVSIPQTVIDDTVADGSPPDGGSWVCWYNSRIYCAWLEQLL